MITDARDDSVLLDRNVPVAVVGAGPAGLAVARRLAPATAVLVVEAGGSDNGEGAVDRLRGDCAGRPYSLETCRSGRLGGTMNLWGGYCAEFEAHDMADRPWVQGGGWPISPEDLAPFLQDTADFLDLGKPDFSPPDVALDVGRRAGLVTSVWRFSHELVDIGKTMRHELEASTRIEVLLHVAAVDLVLKDGHHAVDSVVVETVTGKRGRIRADVIVLAGGGLETPRLLLNADSQIAGGVGNAHDTVGRYFMEHPHWSVAGFEPSLAPWMRATERPAPGPDGYPLMTCFGLSVASRTERRLLNARAHAFTPPDDDARRLGIMTEQAPNPDSRVTLSSSRDSVGIRRICVDWQLTEQDKDSVDTTAHLIVRALESAGGGRCVGEIKPVQDIPGLDHCNHHMGTTRMSVDPRHGVVNPDCRVHGLENLYIAGSSVFPTSGWANPTFTLIALSFRIGDHIRRAMAGQPATSWSAKSVRADGSA